MVKVLIPTKTDDTHALYVKLALEKKGHETLLWYMADIPDKQVHTFKLSDNNTLSWTAKGVDFIVNNIDEFNVVWVRRPRAPVIPNILHADDMLNAKNDNIAFFKTFWQVIAPKARWINPVNTHQSINCKLYQLKIANQIGLKVPETLISNDPNEIKAFINNHPISEVVYKTLYPTLWLNDDEMRLTYTRPIKHSDLPSDQMLQTTPGIFQKKIPKAFEIRLTMMGETPLAVKINSQNHPKGLSDWRFIPGHELQVEAFELPKNILTKCKQLMQACGIVFGCFDLIVTPDDDYYFLEVNEQGQFLWIEEINSNIKMLDAFTEFLIDPSSLCPNKICESSMSLSDFTMNVIELKKQAMSIHKESPLFY